MLSEGLVGVTALSYLFLLFAIAFYGDRRRARGKSIIANPYIYALSLAVYCTSWTFFGSVGRAATQGLPFLTIYLGPTVMALLWWFLLRKLLRICKQNKITTMSDLLALRYGKGAFLGALATAGVLLAVLPYIGLQLKSVTDTFNILVHHGTTSPLTVPVYRDTALYVAVILAVFCILFGARHLDPSERHEGMVAAVAFESLVKILAFLVIGFLVTFGLFSGWGEIFSGIRHSAAFQNLLQVNTGPQNSYTLLLVQTFLAMAAILFLPRQFHMAVVENTEERHILTAMWLLPLYLLLINLFVLPIAFAGLVLGFPPGQGDTFVLRIPLESGHPYFALLAFLGGLSASTAMVAVSSIAVSTMLLNSLVMPAAVRLGWGEYLTPYLLQIKRGAILGVILLGYASYRIIGPSAMLVDMGLIAFAGVMQLVPAILGALYWRDATRYGAIAGLGLGFLAWAYTLVFPYLIHAGWFPEGILETGPFGLAIFKPTAFMGLTGLDHLSHAFFWSMFLNVGAFINISMLTTPSPVEAEQARQFVQVFQLEEEAPREKRFSYLPGLEQFTGFMERFIGPAKARKARVAFSREVTLPETEWGDLERLRLLSFIERTLAGAMGPAAAHVILEGYLSSLGCRMEDVFDMFGQISYSLEESQEKLKRRLSELSVLYEAARRLASSPSLHDLLEAVLDLLVEDLGVEKCSVRLVSEDGLLHIKSSRGLMPLAREAAGKPDPASLLGECLLTPRAISVPDTFKVLDRLQGLLEEEPLASFVLVPLTAETQALGVLSAASSRKGYFAKEHLDFFQSLAGQLGQAVRGAQLEEALLLNESRLEALWDLGQLTGASLHEITDYALEQGVRLTKSEIGYLAFMNKEETVLTMHSWSKVAMEQCAINDKPIVYPLENTGLWGEAVRQRRPIITNDYAAPNPQKKGCPPGHVPMRRHLNVPIFDGGRIVGVAGVGNKEEEYDQSDVRQLTLLMQGMWWLLQRKRAEEAMAERGYKLIQTCMDGIVAHDAGGSIIIFNENAAKILGYAPEEVIGKINIRDLYPLADDITAKIHDTGYGGVGILENFETVARHKDGTLIPIWLSAQLLYEEGQEVGAVGHFRDLRERKRLEEAILQNERLAVLGRMAAHMGHEIKNPLMLIGGFARQVLKGLPGDDSQNREKLQIIVDEIRRLEDFLVEVGTYARFSEPQKQPGDLNALIREICLRLEPAIRESNLNLVLELDPQLPPVPFDPQHLRQVILNIAKNGLEAMSPGGTLTISSGREPGRVFMVLADTGAGFTPEVREKIFQPFYTTKPKGSGLGLAICQKIMQAHQGEIALESEPGKGTRVTLSLPVEP